MERLEHLLYKDLEAKIIDMIARGELKPGDMLHSENALCELFHLSRQTVRKALTSLLESGTVYKIRGKGTYISPNVNVEKLKARVKVGDRAKSETKIAVMIEDVDTFFFEVIRAISTRSSEFGYNPVFYINDTVEHENEAIEKILASDVEGVIFVPFRSGGYNSPKNYYSFKQAELPTVIIGKPPENYHSDSVYVDDVHEVFRTLVTVADYGYKSAIHVTNNMHDMQAVMERKRGYELAVLEAYHAMEKSVVIDMNCESWENQLAEAIRETALPCVLFLDTDLIAYSVYNVIEKMGLSIPQQLGLVGYDNLHKIVNLPVGLSSVQQPYQRMAEAAFELLNQKIMQKQSENGYYKHYVFETEMIVRGSIQKPE